MTTKSALENALEYLINEEEDKAVEAFHNFIVQKARAIHESLIEDDEMDDDIDESLELDEDDSEEKDEEVKESSDEDDDKEEVDENIADVRNEIRSDEYFGRDELTAEDEDEVGDDEAEMDLDNDNEVGDEVDDAEAPEGEEVSMDAEEAQDLAAALEDLSRKFAEITGVETDAGEEGEEGGEEGEMDMDMDMDMEPGNDVAAEEGVGEDGPAVHIPISDLGQYVGEGDDSDDDDKEEVDEAVTHDPGVQKDHKTDEHGKHGDKDNIKHNSDAKLPESAEFDFDLTEEDFLDLEEGLKQIDVKMGGEQGGVKYAGEETNTKSPVAQRDKSDIKADSKDLVSKQKEHGTYNRETAPNSDNLPHSGDNSHESAGSTGSPKRSEVSKGGGLDKQKGYGEGEAGAGKFAGTETNVKSPIGSQGTRNES